MKGIEKIPFQQQLILPSHPKVKAQVRSTLHFFYLLLLLYVVNKIGCHLNQCISWHPDRKMIRLSSFSPLPSIPPTLFFTEWSLFWKKSDLLWSSIIIKQRSLTTSLLDFFVKWNQMTWSNGQCINECILFKISLVHLLVYFLPNRLNLRYG